MSASFNWWRNGLRGHIGDVVEDEPKPGYYRIRNSDRRSWDPVAIWQEADGRIYACRGPEGEPNVLPVDLWMWCCRYPITYQDYLTVARYGKPWPFQVDVPEIGDNSKNAPANEVLGERLAAIRTAADLWLQELGGELKTQADADKAAAWAEEIAKLQKEAEDTFKAEKQPFLDGGREVDNRWRNVRDAIGVNLKWLKNLAGTWITAQRKKAEEEARKINEAAAAAGATAPVVQAAKVTAGAAGATRKVVMKKRQVCEITDLQALVAFIAKLENPPTDFVMEAKRAAFRMLDAGVSVPGAMLKTEEYAA